MAPETNRRSFFTWAIGGLGAIFTAILGFPVICYTIDPRHRKGKTSDFRPVEGIRLEELNVGGPRQGIIRDRRHDGWTLYPNDVVGRVWVVLNQPLPPGLKAMTRAELEQFNSSDENKAKYVRVFTTICPHLGCSVNLDAAGAGFLCPCHAASFAKSGERTGASNPAARGMDTLDWVIDETDAERNRVLVKYQNFLSSKNTKIMA